jgi:hypothetical protein
MALTRSFKELVRRNVAADPAFGEALLREGIDTTLTGDEMVEIGVDFWHTVAASMPDCSKVKAEHLRAIELRQEWD